MKEKSLKNTNSLIIFLIHIFSTKNPWQQNSTKCLCFYSSLSHLWSTFLYFGPRATLTVQALPNYKPFNSCVFIYISPKQHNFTALFNVTIFFVQCSVKIFFTNYWSLFRICTNKVTHIDSQGGQRASISDYVSKCQDARERVLSANE